MHDFELLAAMVRLSGLSPADVLMLPTLEFTALVFAARQR